MISLSSRERKKAIKTILYLTGFISRFIDTLWPKDNSCVVFGSNQGNSMAGSPKYLYEHIKKNNLPYKVFNYLPFQEKGVWSQIRYIIAFAPLFFRAKVLVSSHPPYDFVPFFGSKKKFLINTWHGIPLKCMYFTDPGASDADLKEIMQADQQTSVFLVASLMEAALITRCFLLDPRKIVCLGHPRNDNLIHHDHTNIVKTIIPDLPEYFTLILYCPTYRRNASIRFFPFEDFDNSQLNQFLEKHRIVILTRGHIQEKNIQSAVQSNRIIELRQDQLQEFNDILPEIDILITDYSSIFFDYLLCNKPCIFIPYDKNEYERDVGFLFDDYDFWTPGKKVYTYNEFIETIEDILSGHDRFKAKREEMREIFHYHQKGDSSDKLLHLLNDACYGEKK